MARACTITSSERFAASLSVCPVEGTTTGLKANTSVHVAKQLVLLFYGEFNPFAENTANKKIFWILLGIVASCTAVRFVRQVTTKENLQEGRTLMLSPFRKGSTRAASIRFSPRREQQLHSGIRLFTNGRRQQSRRSFSSASAGFKSSQALAESAWENKKKKRMGTGGKCRYCF